uniref:Uncharacterized protein n=1 Tax=Siphoviridae sp. ctYcY12 TaxID=2825550 RepID=A0A8S5TTY1_9CAUD|nr:MAG TPA: hypothetical protein [Siphoviridae sp. ctYcY12]
MNRGAYLPPIWGRMTFTPSLRKKTHAKRR